MFMLVYDNKIICIQTLKINVFRISYLNNRNIFKLSIYKNEVKELIDKLNSKGIDLSMVKIEWLD